MSGNPSGSRQGQIVDDSVLPPVYASHPSNEASGTHQSNSRYSVRFSPPRYSVVFGDPEEHVPPGALPTEHEYLLHSGLFNTGKPWAKLRILTRPSSISHKVPMIFGADNVAGVVELNLRSPQVIKSIIIILKGRIVTSFSDNGSYTFLENILNLWDKSTGDPRAPSAGKTFDGKMYGDYDFAFSFPFPTEVDISSGSVGKGKRASRPALICSTPQTFLEHNLKANVEYELVLQIAHGILRSDSKLKADVVFIPEITPDPASHMRQNAYLENAMLPGPEADPEGWVALPKLARRGVFKRHRNVNLEYCLYLASPLCYTRGTVIPCYLFISSQDSRCLDDLAHPNVQYVRLGRRITFYDDPGQGIGRHIAGKEPKVSEEFDEAELAVWLVPPKGVLQEPHMRRLEGEIHLAKELRPSSDFLPFKVEYFVEILPFDTHVFEQCQSTSDSQEDTDLTSKVWLSFPVTIATFKGRGPVPNAFTERRHLSMASRRPKDEAESFEQLEKYGLSLGSLVL